MKNLEIVDSPPAISLQTHPCVYITLPQVQQCTKAELSTVLFLGRQCEYSLICVNAHFTKKNITEAKRDYIK